MESGKDIWVDKTLNSINNIKQATPPVGMQAKIMQRLQAERFRMIPDTVASSTVYRIAAAVALIVAMNVFTCVTFSKHVSEKKGLQSFVKEYSINDSGDSFLNI